MYPSTSADRTARHARAPLLESCLAFVARDQAPFYSPGHKGGRSLDRALVDHLAAIDLNNLPDTDTLHCPEGSILEAERLLADAYGVARSFLLVGGSSAGNVAAILSTVAPGERVVVQRNAHKSVVAGLIHAGASPVWLVPEYDVEFGIALGVGVDAVDAAFVREPSAKALVALNPTYFGTTPDIAAIARVCKARGKRLLVDEAHGPHFHFHNDLPTAAEDVGADVVVQSSHKILSALSQAAVLHTSAEGPDELTVRKVLQLIQTTSPSFPIMASIDTARRQMVLDGDALLSAAIDRANVARAALARIDGIEVLGRDHLRGAGSGFFDLDATKIVLRVGDLGMTGFEFQRALNGSHGVQPELGGAAHVLFISTIGNTDEDFARLVRAVEAVARAARSSARPGVHEALHRAATASALPPIDLTPREAFYARAASCPFAQAEGRVAAEVITPYPPGIPAVMPGERLTRDVLEALGAVRRAGCPVSSSDPTLATLRVVA
ncbi:MAG: aminotransferase class I/II-fold pyridoxal phosphate-dependent enzyme [Polyangiales bacterium]